MNFENATSSFKVFFVAFMVFTVITHYLVLVAIFVFTLCFSFDHDCTEGNST